MHGHTVFFMFMLNPCVHESSAGFHVFVEVGCCKYSMAEKDLSLVPEIRGIFHLNEQFKIRNIAVSSTDPLRV